MHRGGPARAAPALQGGEVLRPAEGGGGDSSLGIDVRSLPFGSGYLQNASVARADYQVVNSQTLFSGPGGGSAPVVFDLPATSSPGQMLDLATSKVVLTFSVPSGALTPADTKGWMSSILAFSQARVFLNGKEVSIQSGNLLPFSALHTLLFRRPHTEPVLQNSQTSGFDTAGVNSRSGVGDGAQFTTGITTPWRMPISSVVSNNVQTQSDFNGPAWSVTQAWFDAIDPTRCLIEVKLKDILPMCTDGRFLPAQLCNLRLELTPSNPNFSPCCTSQAFSTAIVPVSAQLWLRRITLTSYGQSMFSAALAEAKLINYPCIVPQTQSFLIQQGSASFSCNVLASGSRPQIAVMHFVRPECINLATWQATTVSGRARHVFQYLSNLGGAGFPGLASLQARINGELFPSLYAINRPYGLGNGSSLVDYEVYKESCQQISTVGSDDFVQPFLDYGSFTDSSGMPIVILNLTENNCSTWQRARSVDKANVELNMQFLGAVPAPMVMVVSLISSEAVSISSNGRVGTTW